MSITIEAQATRTLIQQDGVSRVAINNDGSMELLTPPSTPTGNMVTSFNQFGNSLAASGYQKLPSGLIIQWGAGTTGASGTVATVAFPIAFPTACFQVVGTALGTGSTADIVEIPTISAASFGAAGVSGVSTGAALQFRYLAIGH